MRLRAALALSALIAILAVAWVALAVVVPRIYDEYGYHPEENARSWAALTPRYADAVLCQRCHKAQYTPWQDSGHATVTCESCHGPLAQHAATAPEAAPPGSSDIEKPAAMLCAACHGRGPGKPDGFATVDLAAHYTGGTCTGCHDSHAATATRPHDIPHPLENLPACVVCHVPAGLKPVPAGHVESSDAVCLSCHKRSAPTQ
jgi:hypothetical protein